MTRQLIAPPAVARLGNVRMSYREFLRTDFGDGARVEWVDGEITHMAPLSNENTELQVFLISVLRLFMENQQLGALRIEPFNMKTGPDLPGRSPDILFVANANRGRLKKSHLEGPADLVIEVVSPSSRKLDRTVKYQEYQTGGVQEYWVIDPGIKKAEFFSLGADGQFHPIQIDAAGRFISRILPGFSIRVDILWQSSLPSVMSILKELKIV